MVTQGAEELCWLQDKQQGRIRWLDKSHVFILFAEDKDHLDILFQHLNRITRQICQEAGADGAQMHDYTTDEDSGSDDSEDLEVYKQFRTVVNHGC